MFKLPTLYLITDRTQILGRPLIDVVKSALDGGVRMVQLREKGLSGRALFNLAKELRELTKQYDAKLLINDRIDVALTVDADGVHLGHQSVSVWDVRKAFAETIQKEPIVGVSAHSLEDALEAEFNSADFITFGPVYYTHSKAGYGESLGIGKLEEAVGEVNIPVYALGGVKNENIREVLNTGAYGVAMISAIMAADDIKEAAIRMIEATTFHRPQITCR